MSSNIDWAKITEFYNGVIDEAKDSDLDNESNQLELHIYSKAFDQTLNVIVPVDQVEAFMKNLGLWKANVYSGNPLKV